MYKNLDERRKKTLNMFIIILVVVLLIAICVILMLKYEVEGEKNPPFIIKKMFTISTASTSDVEDLENKWNLEVFQNNDIYIEIEKNENYSKQECIKKIYLQKFKTIKAPNIGKMKIYRPSINGINIFNFTNENEVKDIIEYKSNKNGDVKNLELSNQGGIVAVSFAVAELPNFVSNEEIDVTHDATLLSKVNVNEEDLKATVSFDIIIETESNKIYKANIILDVPNENIIEKGMQKSEKTDFKDIIFKRETN